MRKYILIDSHVLIWLLFEPDRLSNAAIKVLKTADKVCVSIVSLWELTLKYNKGSLDYTPKSMIAGYKAAGLSLLSLTEQYVFATTKLNLQHKDPFDTMLIAQAKVEGYTLLTADKQLIDSPYPTISCVKPEN